jgi:tRNA (guanine37-N1)-methyltransferase
MKFDIITIFPRICESYFKESIIGRAIKNNLIEVGTHNLRDYTEDKHRKVDDTPYGGGAGMVMKIEPIYQAVNSIRLRNKKSRVILFSAKGKKYTQKDAKRLSGYDQLVFICGRYEGVDERVAKYVADEEISIGDYVLTGGEIPAMLLVDSISRLLPGVLGNSESALSESHQKTGYLEHPQYTKPEVFIAPSKKSWRVPNVLLSGNHKEIEKWRKKYEKES